jgi:hypothetical protein
VEAQAKTPAGSRGGVRIDLAELTWDEQPHDERLRLKNCMLCAERGAGAEQIGFLELSQC